MSPKGRICQIPTLDRSSMVRSRLAMSSASRHMPTTHSTTWNHGEHCPPTHGRHHVSHRDGEVWLVARSDDGGTPERGLFDHLSHQ